MAKAVIQVFLGIIAVVSLVGNTLAAILFIKNHQWLKKVHTCLLLALAIQDILTAIGLLVLPGFVLSSDVYDPPSNVTLGQIFCSVIWSKYIPFSLAIASVYTCLMLTIDRWMAALRPMSYRRFSNSAKVIATMVILPWFLGFGLEISAILNVHSNDVNGTNVCSWTLTKSSTKKNTVALFAFFGMILVPALLMVVAYAHIVIKLRRSSLRVMPVMGRGDQVSPGRRASNKKESYSHLKKLTRVVCAASSIVIVCWLPDQLYFCLFQMDSVEFGTPLHDALVILAFVNTCLNPFIYSFSNKQYREEFNAILCCRFRRGVRKQLQETTEHNLDDRSALES